MSSSTGVRKRRTPEDRIDEAIDGVADAYLRKARRYSDKALSQGGALGTGPIYGSINPGTNSLQTSGGAMIGSIAFNPIALVIGDGRINIEPDQNEASKDSSYVLVAGQGSPDDLLFIDGADKNGQLLYLQGTETQIITLKAATITGISNISGLGTVTVVTTSDHNMLTGAKANILDTDNFNISNVTVIRINATTFTYSATGNIFPETAGIVQNGNIVMPDGNDVILNANISPNGVPIATLIFDPTVEGFGAWRLISVSVVSGTAGDFLRVSGGAMFGSIAYDPDIVFVDSDGRVLITSSYIQSTAETAPNNEVFFFDGALFNGQQLEYQVTNQTIQVIKNAILKTITNIVGDGSQIITATIDDTSALTTGDSVNIKDTASYNLDNAIITVLLNGTDFTYDLGSTGATTNETGTMQRGNIVMPDDQDLTLNSDISIQGVAIATFVFDPTIPGGGWRLASSTVSGGGVNLLPLNNVWTGSNTFEGTPFTVTSAVTALAGTISTSITSPAITLGDEASDALSILATSTFSELATFNASVVISGTPFTVTSAVTALAGTISTSITSPLIILGDQATDNIQLVGQVSTNIVMEEISEPGAAPIDTGRFYAKLSGGVSVPFWKDEAGSESSMISGGGDMILSATQTVTGLKTFLNTLLGIRNAANTFTGVFTHSSTVNPVWTLPSINQVLVGTTLSQSLTNKTIDGDLNTILDINETQMNVSVGVSGTILTSNGVGNPPTYQAGGGVDLIPLNNVWTGTNTFQSTFTVSGGVTALASTISTSISSPSIVLGDQATDNINFTGRMNTSIVWNANSSPLGSTENGISLQQSGVIEINATNAVRIEEDGNTICSFSSSGFGPLSSANIKLFVTSSGARSPINIQPKSGVPTSIINGDIFYDTTGSHTLFGRINGVNVDLGAAGGGGSGPPFDDNQVIIQDETDNSKTLTFNLSLVNASAANILSWAVGASRTHTFAPTGGTLAQLNLTQSWTAIQNLNAGLNVSGAITTMFTNLFMSGASITIGANQRIRASTANSEIGIFVTNATSSLGQFGSMQMPVDTGGVGSAAAANTDFGSEIGCFGVYLNNGGAPTFVIKKSATAWAAMTIPNAGNVSAGQLT